MLAIDLMRNGEKSYLFETDNAKRVLQVMKEQPVDRATFDYFITWIRPKSSIKYMFIDTITELLKKHEPTHEQYDELSITDEIVNALIDNEYYITNYVFIHNTFFEINEETMKKLMKHCIQYDKSYEMFKFMFQSPYLDKSTKELLLSFYELTDQLIDVIFDVLQHIIIEVLVMDGIVEDYEQEYGEYYDDTNERNYTIVKSIVEDVIKDYSKTKFIEYKVITHSLDGINVNRISEKCIDTFCSCHSGWIFDSLNISFTRTLESLLMNKQKFTIDNAKAAIPAILSCDKSDLTDMKYLVDIVNQMCEIAGFENHHQYILKEMCNRDCYVTNYIIHLLHSGIHIDDYHLKRAYDGNGYCGMYVNN